MISLHRLPSNIAHREALKLRNCSPQWSFFICQFNGDQFECDICSIFVCIESYRRQMVHLRAVLRMCPIFESLSLSPSLNSVLRSLTLAMHSMFFRRCDIFRYFLYRAMKLQSFLIFLICSSLICFFLFEKIVTGSADKLTLLWIDDIYGWWILRCSCRCSVKNSMNIWARQTYIISNVS